MTFMFTLFMISLSRFFTPKEILIKNHGFEDPYWNINWAHEPFKGIDVSRIPIISELHKLDSIFHLETFL
jgi:hypothetical protein